MPSSANGRGIRLLVSADHVRPTIINGSEDSYCFRIHALCRYYCCNLRTNTDVRVDCWKIAPPDIPLWNDEIATRSHVQHTKYLKKCTNNFLQHYLLKAFQKGFKMFSQRFQLFYQYRRTKMYTYTNCKSLYVNITFLLQNSYNLFYYRDIFYNDFANRV